MGLSDRAVPPSPLLFQRMRKQPILGTGTERKWARVKRHRGHTSKPGKRPRARRHRRWTLTRDRLKVYRTGLERRTPIVWIDDIQSDGIQGRELSRRENSGPGKGKRRVFAPLGESSASENSDSDISR